MILNEKLGIPSEISKQSKKLYESILEDIKRFDNDDPIDQSEFEFGRELSMKIGEYDIKISDLTINVPVILKLYFQYGENKKPFYFSAGQSSRSSIGDDLMLHSDISKGFLSISVAVFKNNKQHEVVDEINKNLKERHIAHELMHLYETYKNKKKTLKQRGEYKAFNIQGLPEILREFLYLLYFTTSIENSVRPAEFYQDILYTNVKKSEFRSYIEKSEIIETLRKSENFSLDDYKKRLEDSEEIKKFLKDAKSKGYKSIGENSDDALNILMINIINTSIESIDNMLGGYTSQSFLGKEIDFDKVNSKFNKIINSYEKFKGSPQKYFEFLVKNLNFVGNKMKKKLYKIYDMIEEKKVIVDWETYCEINKNEIVYNIDFNSFKKK